MRCDTLEPVLGEPEPAEEWPLDGYFRCLGYLFRLRCDSEVAADRIRTVLGAFEVPAERVQTPVPPTPNVPPVYSLCQADVDWELRYGNDVLFSPERFDEVMSHLFWHINAEMARSTGSYLLIHAGAVASPSGEVFILPGDSGSGKTTLVAGLIRNGFTYLSDEAAAIDPISRQLYPYPRALTLKRGSFALFPELEGAGLDKAVRLEEQWFVAPSTLGGKVAVGPHPARWVVVVRYEAGSPTRLETISPGTAVLELARRVMNMPHYGGRALPLLADVVLGASTYRLVTGDLDEAVGALETLASPREPRACESVSIAPSSEEGTLPLLR